MISGSVYVKFKSRALHLFLKPLAGGNMGFAERRAVDSAFFRRTDYRQFVKRGKHTV